MSHSVAIITARGGSKRIPRKNIKEFLGKPILFYSIEAALKSKVFDEVMVSTDDKEIAALALKAGAKVPFYRTEKTSDDHSTTADVILEVLDKYKLTGQSFEKFCCIYPTAPFITAEKLRLAMDKLKSADSVIPVVKFSFPPQRCLVIQNDRVHYKWPENETIRSQDLEPYYHDCGQFYCSWTEVFLRKKTIVTDKTVPFYMNEMEVQDIDTLEDWSIAEIKYQNYIKSEKSKL